MILLDTNICIYIMNNRPEAVRDKFIQYKLSDMAISSITLFELSAGAHKSAKAAENITRLEQFASLIDVLPFDTLAAQKAGWLRHHLRSQGTPIGDMDTLIAAHALALQLTLVTNNEKEFRRVPELSVENWLLDS